MESYHVRGWGGGLPSTFRHMNNTWKCMLLSKDGNISRIGTDNQD